MDSAFCWIGTSERKPAMEMTEEIAAMATVAVEEGADALLTH